MFCNGLIFREVNHSMSFSKEFYTFLEENTLVGIKGGMKRERFLQIWMVEVNQRVFARSWNKSARSWFTAFLEEGAGQIKFGESIFNVTGQKLASDAQMTALINQAYLAKYNQPYNVSYAKGITQPEYAEYTMEFFFESASD